MADVLNFRHSVLCCIWADGLQCGPAHSRKLKVHTIGQLNNSKKGDILIWRECLALVFRFLSMLELSGICQPFPVKDFFGLLGKFVGSHYFCPDDIPALAPRYNFGHFFRYLPAMVLPDSTSILAINIIQLADMLRDFFKRAMPDSFW